MLLNILSFSFGFFLIPYHGISCDDKIQSGVSEGGKAGNPGVKVRITQKGLNYINDVVREQMSIIIPHLRLDDMTFKNLMGQATLTNTKVTNYKRPDIQSMTFHPPNQMVVEMKNMNVAMAGHVRASTLLVLNDEGDFDSVSNRIDVRYALKIFKHPQGQFGVKTASCKATVGECDVNLYNTGPLGQMVQAMKGLMIGTIKPEIGKQICAQGSEYFDQNANEKLKAFPTKIWLNETDPERFAAFLLRGANGQNSQNGQNGQNNQTRASTRRPTTPRPNGQAGPLDTDDIMEMSKNVTKHLMLDYSNIRDPSETADFLETYHKGEISYHGQGGTPFQPIELREPKPYPLDRMFYLIASDYMANSMLYHSFVHDLLKYRVSADDTPHLAEYLQTSCDSDFFGGSMCLGTLIPQIQDSFPNSLAEIYVESNKLAPAVFFQQDGLVRIQAPVTVSLNAKKGTEKRVMLISDVDVTARASLRIENQMIKGNVSVDKLDMRVRENHLRNFNEQNGLNELKGSIKTLMELMGNAYLKKGLPLPVVRGMKLINTRVNVFERTIRIDSDCEADQKIVSKIAAKAIQENGDGARVEGIDTSGI